MTQQMSKVQTEEIFSTLMESCLSTLVEIRLIPKQSP